MVDHPAEYLSSSNRTSAQGRVRYTADPTKSLIPLNALNSKLCNRYFGLRHGQSLANVQGVVVSNPDIGTARYGLTEAGKRQVEMSVNGCRELDENTKLICSDFKRARETAGIIQKILACAEAIFDIRLRERNFGALDLQSNTAYEKIWRSDSEDPTHSIGGCESAVAVYARVVDLIETTENQFKGQTILLISHGDPLQFLQTAFLGYKPSMHRTLPPWETAEIRELKSTNNRS